MARTYDLFKKSDMNRLQRDLMSDIKGSVRKQAMSMKYDTTCPHCNRSIAVAAGGNICPFCRNGIDLNIKFDF